jgi:hypothetical protein
MSVLERSPRHAVHDTMSGPEVSRLVLASTSTAAGVPDGAWWPQSRDPTAELPTLIPAVDAWMGPVLRIALNAAAWDGRPQVVRSVDGRDVRLDWFGAPDAHMIILFGNGRSRLDLVMIPADTATTLALFCLATAAGAPKPHASAAQPAEPERVDRWETDGGTVQEPA